MQQFEFRIIGSVAVLKDASYLAKVRYRKSLRNSEFRGNRFSERYALLRVVTKFCPIFYIPCPILTKCDKDTFIKKIGKWPLVRENRRSESHTLLKDVWKFPSVRSRFIVQFWWKSKQKFSNAVQHVSFVKICMWKAALFLWTHVSLHVHVYRAAVWHSQRKERLAEDLARHRAVHTICNIAATLQAAVHWRHQTVECEITKWESAIMHRLSRAAAVVRRQTIYTG
jgi:hypothetical protein